MTRERNTNDFEWWLFERKTHGDIIKSLIAESESRPWCSVIAKDPPMMPGNLNSRCRLRFVPFDRCLQDRFYYIDGTGELEIVAAGGITTQFSWDGRDETIPGGWEESVQRAYLDQIENSEANTLVALLAFTSPRFRGQGLAGLVIDKMVEIAKTRNFSSLVVPALPPSQFEKDKIDVPMKRLSTLRHEDGSAYDYWIRLHEKKGARVIGGSDSSHRFAMTISDFNDNVSSTQLTESGDFIVTMDKDLVLGANGKNMHQRVFVDSDRDLVSFDWGCVWMKYDV